MNYIELSKKISYALRHSPHECGLKLADEGWADLTLLIEYLRNDYRFINLTETDIYEMINMSEKKRHEIVNGRIRAVYGHTTNKKVVHKPSIPPHTLYHGTANRFLDGIFIKGLISKDRQYVHLSEDIETAICVGKRRDDNPAILKIDVEQACMDGVLFYFANEKIWLADVIPVKYLKLI